MSMTNATETIGLDEVHRLRQAGIIDGRHFLQAAVCARDGEFWSLWARRALLALGAAHLLAGIVFFFAFNWAEMPAWLKFMTVQGAIALSVLAAFWAGPRHGIGEVCLIAASVLTGVLLAVVGQVYQTGADAYELFVAWTLLILPWVLASLSATHWLLWLVVLYLALGLFGEQVLVPEGRLSSVEILTILGLIGAPVLAAREFGVGRGLAWLSGRWNRLILLMASFALLFLPGFGYVLDANGEVSGLVALVAGLGVAGLVYRRWLPDFAAVVIVLGLTSLLLMSVGYRLLDELVGLDWHASLRDLAVLAVLIAWCVLVTGIAATLMRRLHAAMEAGR